MTESMKKNSNFKSWKEEKNSVYLYKIVSECSSALNQKELFSQLAQKADEQALLWENELRKTIGDQLLVYIPDLRTKIVGWLIPILGPRSLRTILAAMKIRGISIYSHDVPGHPMPKSIDDIGRYHKSLSSGNNLRAAVFGINDGLLSNAGLIMGLAGGLAEVKTIILAGFAGLFAGAFSMAAGEYISVRSQREMFEYQIDLERKELELYPDEEAEELIIIYEARGLPRNEAKKIVDALMKNPKNALDVLAREELGLNPDELVSPYFAAFFSFLSFIVGAGIPLLPFLFTQNFPMEISIGLIAVCLFSVGSILSLYTGYHAIRSGLRMLSIGVATSIITFLIGHFLGTNLG